MQAPEQSSQYTVTTETESQPPTQTRVRITTYSPPAAAIVRGVMSAMPVRVQSFISVLLPVRHRSPSLLSRSNERF
jgi:hypothetical protein